jgi:hypothetical protein
MSSAVIGEAQYHEEQEKIATESGIKQYIRNKEEELQLGKEKAARFSTGKIRHDLIPPWILDEVAKVYTYGTKKYDANNWWKGLTWSENVIGPLKRHLNKWLRGEVLDDESNCHHLAMTIWQCICLMEYERNKLGVDDRIPYSLDMMDPKEQNRRIKLWKKLAKVGKNKEYNGLKKSRTKS